MASMEAQLRRNTQVIYGNDDLGVQPMTDRILEIQRAIERVEDAQERLLYSSIGVGVLVIVAIVAIVANVL